MTTLGQPKFYPEGGPTAIRDGAVALLKATGYFKAVFRNKTTPSKDDQLPCARVRIMRDDTEPMGDNNVGTPTFTHTLTLAVIIVVAAASDDALTAALDDLSLKTRTALLCDNDWRQTFEGIEKASIHPNYPNETNGKLVEAPIEIVVTFRSEWPAYLPNTLETIGATVEPRRPPPPWLCPLCQHANKLGALACSVCATPAPPTPTPAPTPTTFPAQFDLSEPTP